MDRHLKPVRPFEGLSQRDALSRRDFLRVAASAGAVGAGALLLGACGSGDGNDSATSTPAAVVDPPPETTTIRLSKGLAVCPAPIYLAEQFLPAEGFTNVQYIDDPQAQHLAAGEIDMHLVYAPSLTARADAGDPLVILAGVHPTCYELWGNDRVPSLGDLKGKRIYIQRRDATDGIYLFMATLLAFVGIDIKNEVEFVELSQAALLSEVRAGTIDALLIPPPFSAILKAENLGLHVVFDGLADTPWSHYFCCMAVGNRDFVEKHPAAAKRALRAILKAADLCVNEPEQAARYLVDKGYWPSYAQALHTIMHMSYASWREFDPEDTVRFYALRLREAGIVKRTPDEIIARGTDWRYLNEIKRELGV